MRMPTRDRYQNDPVFHRLVDMLRHALLDSNFTATEVREAAMLACEMHEYQHVRPLLIKKNEMYQTAIAVERFVPDPISEGE